MIKTMSICAFMLSSVLFAESYKYANFTETCVMCNTTYKSEQKILEHDKRPYLLTSYTVNSNSYNDTIFSTMSYVDAYYIKYANPYVLKGYKKEDLYYKVLTITNKDNNTGSTVINTIDTNSTGEFIEGIIYDYRQMKKVSYDKIIEEGGVFKAIIGTDNQKINNTDSGLELYKEGVKRCLIDKHH
ncbi:MAG: hypothetical protein ACRC5M_03470 [Anaeroplasmataceae bacterium]